MSEPPQYPTGTTFDEAYRTNYEVVRGFLYRLGVRGPDLKDAVHDTFATAMRRWTTYDQTRPVRPWLFGIAFRHYADERAKLRHSTELRDESADGAASDDPERTASARQRLALMTRALDTLDPTRRAAFLMHHLDGLSPQEVSDAMQVPLATTYTRLRTARLELVDAMKQLEGGAT